MRLRALIVGVCSIGILLTACNGKTQTDNVAAEGNNYVEGTREMTEEQKTLLSKISVNEKRIQEGILLQWQEEVLKQYDYSLSYLEGKYPSYEFHITDCEPKNKLNSYSAFTFQEAQDSEKYYSLYLYEEDGKYSAKDNFYGTIIKEAYELGLIKLMEAQDISCDRVDARLDTVQDERFCENMDIETILNGELEMSQITTFYIDSNHLNGMSYQEITDRIHQLMNEKKIYGGYFVTVYDSLNGDKEVFQGDFNVFH